MSAPRELPHDAVLPHLARLFDKAYMARALQCLFDGSHVVTDCTIERVKYRPRRACVVGYKLRLRSSAAGATYEQRIALCMYDAHDARARYAKAQPQTPRAGAALAPVSLLPELNALAWAFPHDRKLPALPQLADAARFAAEDLPALLAPRWGAAARVLSHTHTVVSYFPEHTCTFNGRVILSSVYGESECLWSIYAKTRYDDAGAITYRNMRALRDSEAHRRGEVGYARPLAYDAARRLLWQEGIDAPTLDSVLDDADAALLGRVGQAIAALHVTPLACERLMRGADIVTDLQRAQQVLELAFGDAPELVATCADLAGELGRAWRHVDCTANATLHGDLHSKNMLVGETTIALIDLDRVARGPALAELGGFLAELIYRACLQRRAVDYQRLSAIAAAYARAVPWLVDHEQLAWHTAAALVRERVYRCITSLKPGRVQTLPQVLQIARELLRGKLALSLPGRASASSLALQA